jgi:hypothetical protein
LKNVEEEHVMLKILDKISNNYLDENENIDQK